MCFIPFSTVTLQASSEFPSSASLGDVQPVVGWYLNLWLEEKLVGGGVIFFYDKVVKSHTVGVGGGGAGLKWNLDRRDTLEQEADWDHQSSI